MSTRSPLIPTTGDTGAAAAEARAGLEAAVTEIRALYPSKQHFTRTKGAGLLQFCYFPLDQLMRHVFTYNGAASHDPFANPADGFGKPCSTEFEEELLRLYQAHRGPLLGFHMQVRVRGGCCADGIAAASSISFLPHIRPPNNTGGRHPLHAPAPFPGRGDAVGVAAPEPHLPLRGAARSVRVHTWRQTNKWTRQLDASIRPNFLHPHP